MQTEARLPEIMSVLAERGGNIASLGKLYRDGLLDGFQIKALLPWMSHRRFMIFHTRWGVFGGNFSAIRAYFAEMGDETFARIYGGR